MDLKNKTISSAIWSFVQQFGVQSISFVVQIILARLLLPEDFGLIAMIQIFISIGKTLMDAGMTSSLIRDSNVGDKDYSTVFFINLFTSIFIYLVLFLLAPSISNFFEQPLLTLIIRVYTITFILQSIVAVQVTKLTKELNFKLQMHIQIPSTLIGGISGIIMANLGFGVWSIVWMNIISKTVFMLSVWFKTEWRPKFILDNSILKHHFNFGYKLTLSGLITNVYLNSYKIIVGKFFSLSQLGFYNQADMLRMFPVANLTATLQKVTYPMFSLIQNDDNRLKKVFRDITSLVFFIICPIMLYLAIIAEPLFRLVLGENWLPAVPFFQILAISSFVYPLSIYNLNIILVKGRTDLHLKMELIKKISSIFFLFLIYPFGIWGVIYAQSISMFIHFSVNAYYCGKLLNFPIYRQISDLIPTFFINSFIALLLYSFNLFSTYHFGDFLLIMINLIFYFSLYYLISKLLSLKDLNELESLIKKIILKIR